MSFEIFWQNACAEKKPDPKGAAGRFMAELAGLLDVTQIEGEWVDTGAIFLMDLERLGFREMDFNVVMISQLPQTEEEEFRQTEQLREYRNVVKSNGFCFQILLSDTAPADPKTRFANVVYMYGQDLREVFEANVPASAWLGIIRRQVPLRSLCPYSTTRVARGPMFVGRRSEVSDLTQDLRTDFVVTGARRIGKTSLLERAHDTLRIRPEYRQRTHLFICLAWGNFQNCLHNLVLELDEKEELRRSFGPRGDSHQYNPRNISYLLKQRSRDGAHPLFLFFDELDRVVEMDAMAGWPFFKVLAEATLQGWIRVVFAGYRMMPLLFRSRTLCHDDFSHTVPDSPYYQRLEELELVPLDKSDCHILSTRPLQKMEMVIQQRAMVRERIWESTLGYPFFVQFFGRKLFGIASKRSNCEVTLDDVHDIEESKDLTAYLIEFFLENTIFKGRPVATERLCVLLLANTPDDAAWNAGDFLKALAEIGRPTTLDAMQSALRNLERAHIFKYESGRYGFTLPLLKKALQETYPDGDNIWPLI